MQIPINRNTKICSKNVSLECSRYGDHSLFHQGTRECKNCYKVRNQAYYNANKHKWKLEKKVGAKVKLCDDFTPEEIETLMINR